MDTYLDIAVTVLRAARRPLSPRALLAAAYRNNLVPAQLYGKTQHKTLQARLSEDIIARRDHSLFFRTEPGRFFLREFLTDTTIPEEFRLPFPTRRRIRELERGPALAVDCEALKSLAEVNTPISPDKVFDLLKADRFRYEDPKSKHETSVFVRSFVCVHRKEEILTYRLGRYRDNRDTFLLKRSLGFSTLVDIDTHTLFNQGDFGIVEAGVRATKIDLDIPDAVADGGIEGAVKFFIWSRQASEISDLLAVIHIECPAWFEPVKRRLALNDVKWLDFRAPVNSIDDFDPWSKTVLSADYRASSLPLWGHP